MNIDELIELGNRQRKEEELKRFSMNRVEYIQNRLQQLEYICEQQALLNLDCELCGSKKNKHLLRLIPNGNIRYELKNLLVLCDDCLCRTDEVLKKRSNDIKSLNIMLPNMPDIKKMAEGDDSDVIQILNQILKKLLVFDI